MLPGACKSSARCPFLRTAANLSVSQLAALSTNPTLSRSCPFLSKLKVATASANGQESLNASSLASNPLLPNAGAFQPCSAGQQAYRAQHCRLRLWFLQTPLNTDAPCNLSEEHVRSFDHAQLPFPFKPASVPATAPVATAVPTHVAAAIDTAASTVEKAAVNVTKEVRAKPAAAATPSAGDKAKDAVAQEVKAPMNPQRAEVILASKMDKLKAEGRYRVFFDIERQAGNFPKAFNHGALRHAERRIPDEVRFLRCAANWGNNATHSRVCLNISRR